jgi:hypothetical protein
MPARDPRVRRASSSLAAAVRWHPDADTTEARARLAEASAEADVASWPPLSAEARAKIACAILSAGSDAPAA